jgi:outer membrane protein insertion porin family
MRNCQAKKMPFVLFIACFLLEFIQVNEGFARNKNYKNFKQTSKKSVVKKSEKSTQKNKSNLVENNKTKKESIPQIIVKGNERISNETILSYFHFSEKETDLEKSTQDAIKKLYESDLFLEVKIYQEEASIIVEVKENPIVAEIKFIGNKKMEDDALHGELSLKKRSVFTKSKLQSDLKRINEIYLKSGRFLANIDPKIIAKEQNRVEVIFDIKEGKPAKIGEIYFVGNDAFSDRELLDEVSTKKSKWYKFLSSSDIYDSDRVEFDKEKLRRFYGSKGYADFNVISAVAQISPTKDRFFITFLMEEGIKYNLGEIEIVNHIEKFDEKVLEKEILINKGEVYNSDLIEKTIDRMIEVMSEKSYAFANVEPVLKRNREQKIIDIDFVISESPKVYINNINISGNTRTLDEVIRRELRLREGDPYNIVKINRSKQRIQNTGFFETVEIKTNRIGNSDKVDLLIEVKEKKTGELNLGVGYSTVDRFSVSSGIKESNLFGTGQEISLNVQKSTYRLSLDAAYVKPYFLGYPINFGLSVFKYQMDKRNSLVYSQDSNGLIISGDYSITEFLSHQIRYFLSTQSVRNVDSLASQNIQNLKGDFTSTGVGQTLTYNKLDNNINPKKGYYISISQDYSGLGGNIKNIKHEGSASYYIPVIVDDFVFKASTRGGMIDGLGQDVRSNYAFFLGGNNFRGFQYAGIGPRAKVNGNAVGGNALGGNIYYMGILEFKFPLGLPRELGINGILFSDNGTLKKVDAINKKGSEVVDTGSIRSSYGLSIAWSSPMGPIRLDFSRILRKEQFDQSQNFRFSFGTSF